jgi:hypothetical protein
MRLFTTLLLVPIGLAVTLIAVVPGSVGVVVGLGVALLYFVTMTIRASDWT